MQEIVRDKQPGAEEDHQQHTEQLGTGRDNKLRAGRYPPRTHRDNQVGAERDNLIRQGQKKIISEDQKEIIGQEQKHN